MADPKHRSRDLYQEMSEAGNSLFVDGKYEEALASYSDAIVRLLWRVCWGLGAQL